MISKRPLRRIFLDFDGVLRRQQSSPHELEPELVARFERVVLSRDHVRVVIASQWRVVHSVDQLRRLFSPALRERIEGKTPQLYQHFFDGNRQAEVETYLGRVCGMGQPWLAIDDMPHLYRRGAPLLATDPNSGFDEVCAARLEQWIDVGRPA